MGCLGEAHENGYGLPKDLAKAVEWYRRGTHGTEFGNAACQAQLGECYEYGKGVAVDLAEALRWYEMALKNGLSDVQPAIDRVRAATS
jgi:TPR repeat protein